MTTSVSSLATVRCSIVCKGSQIHLMNVSFVWADLGGPSYPGQPGQPYHPPPPQTTTVVVQDHRGHRSRGSGMGNLATGRAWLLCSSVCLSVCLSLCIPFFLLSDYLIIHASVIKTMLNNGKLQCQPS